MRTPVVYILLALSLPSFAVGPYKKKKIDPRKRLTQPLVQPILPWVDPGGVQFNLQPSPDLNSAVASTLTNAISAGRASDPNTFKKNPGTVGGVPNVNGKGGGAFSYNSGGGNGGGNGDGGGDDGGGGGGGGKGKQKQGKGSRSGGAQAFAKWWPMCLFLDPSISTEEGNATVKGLIDDAAKCQVNLVVFPVTIQANYPESPDTINGGSQTSCNLVPTLNDKASTSVCVHYDRSADEMCGEHDPKKKDVAGCAQLQAGASKKLHDKYDNDPTMKAALAAQKNETQDGAAGVAAPSIEDAGACTKDIVGHEAIGHSQMGQPNGESHGKGIGKPKAGGGPEGSASGDWTAEGCASFVENAADNDGRWKYDPNRTQYYTKIEDPSKQWNLLGGQGLFKPPQGPPPPGKPPKGEKPGGNGPQSISYDEGGGKNPGGGGRVTGGGGGGSNGGFSVPPPANPAVKDFAVVPPSKHRRKNPQQAMIDNLGDGIKEPPLPKTPANANDNPPPNYPVQPAPPPAAAKAKAPDRLEYDESAPKARSDSGGGGSFQQAVAGPPPGDGGFTVSAPSAVSGGGGKTTIGYDESAPKGGGGSFSSNIIRMGSAVGGANSMSGGAADIPPLPGGGPGSVKISPSSVSPGLSADFFKDAGTGSSSDSSASEDDKNDPRRRRRAPASGGARRPSSIRQRGASEEGAAP